MTDIQILTVAIAVVFPTLGVIGAIAALIHSNKRLDDLRSHLDQKLDSGFEHMELLLKLHVAEHHGKS